MTTARLALADTFVRPIYAGNALSAHDGVWIVLAAGGVETIPRRASTLPDVPRGTACVFSPRRPPR